MRVVEESIHPFKSPPASWDVISVTVERWQVYDTDVAASVGKLRNRKGMPAMIVEVDGAYQVLSKSGKNLGGPDKTLEEAKRRLRQVEYFKHVDGVK